MNDLMNGGRALGGECELWKCVCKIVYCATGEKEGFEAGDMR